ETTFVDFIHGDVEAAIRPNTRLLYTETICNPLLEVPDLSRIAKIAHDHGALFFIDNTFATPVVARPLAFGADLSLYSATKYLGGHSDLTGGAAAGSAELIARIRRTLVLYGPILSPSESWLLARSLRTLELRVTRHSQNALEVARFLEGHPKVSRVYYPGLESSPYHKIAARQFSSGLFGGMLSFDLDSAESAAKLIAALPTIKYVPSLAGTATTLSWPARTSHRAYSPEARAAAGIAEGQLRLSVGLENSVDLIAELNAGLNAI
ncbi:MAG: PLP-dependent transferase, partial [Pyramidobacter sp.]|nr:PLP-dependent transferase [Pyramidobacter sp.]